MSRRIAVEAIVLAALALFSLGGFVWVLNGSFGACVRGGTDDSLQKTITALDGIVDLELKLSTAIIGFVAALFVGLKGGLNMTAPVRISLLVSAALFVQSALYSVWWRFGIAQSWLNACLNMVAEDNMQRRYEAHLGLFLLGLLSLGGVVFIAALTGQVKLSTPGSDP